MATELSIATLTGRVAQSMSRARATLDSVADSLQNKNYGRMLQSRLEDIDTLNAGGARVQQAEYESEVQGRLATRTQDRGDMDRWSDADTQVRRSFNSAQQDAGHLMSRIGAAQSELNGFHEDLTRSSASLDQALRDVDTLEQFPEYGKSETSEGLRNRLTDLKGLTTRADSGLKAAFDQLENARTTAGRLELASLEVGDGRHSAAIRIAGTSLTSDVRGARDGLSEVRDHIDANMTDVNDMAQYGIDEAVRTAELKNAVRAGTNPTTEAEQAGDHPPQQQPSGAQDPRIRFMQGHTPGSAPGRGE
ncbi:hypothetical protein JOF29_007659 [Kribbella aluminosa]|uniref:Phage shock protein A (PspA) family protein n=1 Tax=Kribbella aluminosa TaxID=416017 RepID=A0ABS4UY23_9ACTN|nr:hypothetical protein [Kribbella aluminosa]MBP2356549.1 hypothetical protein [Kribbella aluminosa]